MLPQCRKLGYVRQRFMQHQQFRHVTALYITGDKAKETYATLHPFMDFAKIHREREELQYSITKRRLDKDISLSNISNKYKVFEEFKSKIEQLDHQRESVASQLRELTKKTDTRKQQIEDLKLLGKELRQQQKVLRETLYPIEDEFAHEYLNLPNNLHPNCAIDGKEKLIYRNGLPPSTNEDSKSHITRTDLIRFINNDRYYMFRDAAKFEIFATQALTRYFVNEGNFQQMANPDFVRCVLLEANATPLEQYHKVIEQQLQNQLNCAYLVGGASFESYLAGVTRLCVYPSVLPLRYVCAGRIYEKSKRVGDGNVSNLFTATQSNAVQTFVATSSQQEADAQFEEILNLAVNFYKSLNIHFRIVYSDASALTAAESLRASIEVFSPAENRYVCVGRISNYGDFVSKRILFCTRKQRDYQFLNLVGGPVLFTTRLIAALIENEIPLNYEQILGAYQTAESAEKRSAIDEFKDVFK